MAQSYACRPVSCFRRERRLGEGTFGTVFLGTDLETGEVVALKELKLAPKGGFPTTSVRELSVLRRVRHPNVVELREVAVGREADKIYLVFEYCEHDFRAQMEAMRDVWGPADIKCVMRQLLEGVAHLHASFILHRDLKPSNLLMNGRRVLKLADFGLARRFGHPLRRYSPHVMTLWYRPPEILLGCESYHSAADMWSVGCIFGELLLRRPLLPGSTDVEQLCRIVELIGSPTSRIAPLHEWKRWEEVRGLLPQRAYSELRERVSGEAGATEHALDLLHRMLTYDPARRISAAEALAHPYFKEMPLPQRPHLLPVARGQSPSSSASGGGGAAGGGGARAAERDGDGAKPAKRRKREEG